jgi:hypothetical protein
LAGWPTCRLETTNLALPAIDGGPEDGFVDVHFCTAGHRVICTNPRYPQMRELPKKATYVMDKQRAIKSDLRCMRKLKTENQR